MGGADAWPTWLGDPLSDPGQAPGWGGGAATGGEAHGSRGSGDASDDDAMGGGDDGGVGSDGGGARSGDGGGGSGGDGRDGGAGRSVADEIDAHTPDDARARKRPRLRRTRGSSGGLSHDDRGLRLGALGRRPEGPGDDG